MVVKRTMDEMITHFNDVVSEMNIPRKDKMTLLGMITAIGIEYQQAADAIEELAKDLERSKEYETFWNKEAKEALRRFQVAVANKPRWIPVTERLPEDGQWVLVWGRGQKIPIMMFRESGAWIDDQFEFYTTVTNWMPLPEPPKEET